MLSTIVSLLLIYALLKTPLKDCKSFCIFMEMLSGGLG